MNELVFKTKILSYYVLLCLTAGYLFHVLIVMQFFFIFSTNERVLMSPTTQSCSVFLTLSHRCWGCLEHRLFVAMPLAAFSKKFTLTKSHNRTLLSHNWKKVAFVIRWMYRNSKYRGPHLAKDYYMPEVMSMEEEKIRITARRRSRKSLWF